MIMKFLFLIVFSGCSEAASPLTSLGQSANLEIVQVPTEQAIKEDDYALKLKSLPALTPESILWNISPSKWKSVDLYIYKGRVFSISRSAERREPMDRNVYPVQYKSVEKNRFEEAFNVYGSKKVSGNPIFQFKDGKLYKGKEVICHKSSDKFSFGLLENKTEKVCPVDIGYLSDGVFKASAFNLEESWLSLNVSGNELFLDISVCKTKPILCKVENRVFSQFEIDWVELWKHRIRRDVAQLNFYIDELLPCVKKMNVACIDKYVVTKKEALERSRTDANGEPVAYRPLSLQEKISELEACLSYDKLLPHLKATVGKKYICIFNAKTSLSVALPSDLDIAEGFNCPKNTDCMKIYPLKQ